MDNHLIIDKLALPFTKRPRCLSNLKFKKESIHLSHSFVKDQMSALEYSIVPKAL